MCDINIDYFYTIEKDDTITFTPKELIRYIIWDYSNSFIPFSNGKRYNVYQDLIFKLIDYYEKYYPYISIQIHKVDEVDKLLPSLVVSKVKEEDKEAIIKVSMTIMTEYINRKFSLFV
jgi:hypothetical protein